MNRAVYPGSFDPFTYGHLDIVTQSAKLFDKLTIIIANNKDKVRTYKSEDVKIAIETTLKACALNNVDVIIYDGLIADYMYLNDIFYLVRGIRNNMDYDYEENVAKINNIINPKIKTVYFRALKYISSSMVKELYSFGKNISAFVPTSIHKLMKQEENNSEK